MKLKSPHTAFRQVSLTHPVVKSKPWLCSLHLLRGHYRFSSFWISGIGLKSTTNFGSLDGFCFTRTESYFCPHSACETDTGTSSRLVFHRTLTNASLRLNVSLLHNGYVVYNPFQQLSSLHASFKTFNFLQITLWQFVQINFA